MELSPISTEHQASLLLHGSKTDVDYHNNLIQFNQIVVQQNKTVPQLRLDHKDNDQDQEDDSADLTTWLSPRKIIFNKDQESGRLSITVIDKVTEEVIQEIPPERVLEMLNKIQKNLGYLIDQEV